MTIYTVLRNEKIFDTFDNEQAAKECSCCYDGSKIVKTEIKDINEHKKYYVIDIFPDIYWGKFYRNIASLTTPIDEELDEIKKGIRALSFVKLANCYDKNKNLIKGKFEMHIRILWYVPENELPVDWEQKYRALHTKYEAQAVELYSKGVNEKEIERIINAELNKQRNAKRK